MAHSWFDAFDWQVGGEGKGRVGGTMFLNIYQYMAGLCVCVCVCVVWGGGAHLVQSASARFEFVRGGGGGGRGALMVGGGGHR